MGDESGGRKKASCLKRNHGQGDYWILELYGNRVEKICQVGGLVAFRVMYATSVEIKPSPVKWLPKAEFETYKRHILRKTSETLHSPYN